MFLQLPRRSIQRCLNASLTEKRRANVQQISSFSAVVGTTTTNRCSSSSYESATQSSSIESNRFIGMMLLLPTAFAATFTCRTEDKTTNITLSSPSNTNTDHTSSSGTCPRDFGNTTTAYDYWNEEIRNIRTLCEEAPSQQNTTNRRNPKLARRVRSGFDGVRVFFYCRCPNIIISRVFLLCTRTSFSDDEYWQIYHALGNKEQSQHYYLFHGIVGVVPRYFAIDMLEIRGGMEATGNSHTAPPISFRHCQGGFPVLR